MKKLLSVSLALLMLLALFAGCSGSKDNGGSTAPENSGGENISPSIAAEATPTPEATEAPAAANPDDLVEVTFPAVLYEDVADEDLADGLEESGFTDVRRNADGSVTVTMTEETRQEYIKEMETALEEATHELTNAEEGLGYSAFRYSEDLSSFEIETDGEMFSGFDSLYGTSLLSIGIIHRCLTGTDYHAAEDTTVTFIDKNSGEVLQSGGYAETMAVLNEFFESWSSEWGEGEDWNWDDEDWNWDSEDWSWDDEDIIDQFESWDESVYDASDFDIVPVHQYADDWGDYYEMYTVTNNGSDTASVHGMGIAYNEAGEIADYAYLSVDTLAPGQSGFGIFSYYPDEEETIAEIRYAWSFEEAYGYPCLDDISISTIDTVSGVTALVTNNGDSAIDYAAVYAVFMDDAGDVVDYSVSYASDYNDELPPALTIPVELLCWEDYDRVELYVDAARYDDSAAAGAYTPVDDANISWQSYLSDSGWGYLQNPVVVENGSDRAVGIFGIAYAFGADGAMLGATTMTIPVLSPDMDGLGIFWFESDERIDHVEYELYCYEPSYVDVAPYMEVSAEAVEDGIEMTVTNGSEDLTADDTVAYVLFFDEERQFLDYASASFYNEDNWDFAPGETLTNTAFFYDEYEAAEIYLQSYSYGW